MVIDHLVDLYIILERSTIFNGQINYSDWAIFHNYIYIYEFTRGYVAWDELSHRETYQDN